MTNEKRGLTEAMKRVWGNLPEQGEQLMPEHAAAIACAHEALNADAGVMRQLPEGWKLVPIEPTANMIRAMAKAWQDAVDSQALDECILEYRAALIAAPTPPAEQQGDLVSVTREDGNNYCVILRELGMEEEGDPVAEVKRLKALAEQQGEHEPVAYLRAKSSMRKWSAHEVCEADWTNAFPVYTHPDNRLAELRAKIEGMPQSRGPRATVYLDDVLAEIDKMMGEQR